MHDNTRQNSEIEYFHWLLSEARDVSQRILDRLQRLRDQFPSDLGEPMEVPATRPDPQPQPQDA